MKSLVHLDAELFIQRRPFQGRWGSEARGPGRPPKIPSVFEVAAIVLNSLGSFAFSPSRSRDRLNAAVWVDGGAMLFHFTSQATKLKLCHQAHVEINIHMNCFRFLPRAGCETAVGHAVDHVYLFKNSPQRPGRCNNPHA